MINLTLVAGKESAPEKEAALLSEIGSNGCQVNIFDSRASFDSNQTECTNYGYFCNWGTQPSSPPISRRLVTEDPALLNLTWNVRLCSLFFFFCWRG